MRRVDVETLDALAGSRPADSLTVWAWRAGSLVVPEPLLVKDWSFDDDAGDSVKVGQRISLTVADPDGSLGAWRFDDPLGVGGTKLQVIYNVGGSGAINYGWFRVTANNPTEFRESRVIDEYGYVEPDGSLPKHKRRVFVQTGIVQLTAVDLTGDVDRDRLQAPESPKAGATVVSEFKRFTSRYFPTVVDPGVADTGVSRQLVYDKERLEACQDLLSRVSARYRMGGDGECHIYPQRSDSVLRIEPNAGLVSVSRGQSIDGLYNRWVVEGKNVATGDPVFGVADIESGPLKYGGPHGQVPFFYTSEMITTVAQATTYAQELRDQFLGSLAVELSVETIPRPELQAGDRVEVGCPVPSGHVVYLPGEVTSIRRRGDTLPRETSMTVSCAYTDVIAALDRTEWAKWITPEMPELTWNMMPAHWGSLPAITWSDV
ncbi:hypothetical protein [Paenarthrobacter ureafaciens]|uniref:hypothetical protein n=1 Tax=Paenarthrobacter ureafaciens TaxID=37931 RepID=UPI00140D8322|nr:hypothetical protein [Paenarthrobacter ureafaciens]MCX8455362.1 hypothetical protein [Paenarthrobacter ureafaciens]MCY0974089.1 hypothetical protein [Paenarthrobacter ureafaciens]